MKKCLEFFFFFNKCFISEFFCRFCQILFNLACMLTAHHEKCFVPALLRSLLITYLIILSLEKETIVLKRVWK